ncbi:VirD4-like conjugal transfer protein, CD1115 family [Enterococcus rivorum]|uniref:VirD4-like conjugal transfer protein, CD1115 family n=1 Tax=Enterococcus rivorum TaxID=762845 RepID=UPI000B1B8C9B|nr:type IV secretory system conjugative DNA transfer family protein [Enterococcus rivorum]MBP2098808.1 type IV secretion system protein VirD4 [Enterococcus rivorum]
MFISKLKKYFAKADQPLAKRVLMGIVIVVATLFANLITSAFYNIFVALPEGMPTTSMLGFHMIRYSFTYVIIYGLSVGIYYFLWLKIKISYEPIEEGKKATSRFTTLDELIAQYKQVPLKSNNSEETYEGLSGTIVARHKDKLFIDTDPAHNFTLGRSRSAKGQTKVLPDMDVYSRSEEKPHLVIASGKYELAVAAIPEYIRRGYEPSVLNLIHLERSFMYNCVDLVKQAYLEKDIDNAIELCKTFSYPLYHNDEAKEPVWEETAMALVNAVILALCYEFIEKSDSPKETEKYVSMYAVSNMLVELGTPDESGDTLLDRYFDSLPPGNPAKMEYSTVKYAEGQMRSSIFATTQAKLRNFIAPKVAKMMSKSTFDFRRCTKDSTVIDMTAEVEIHGIVNTEIPGEYTLSYEITNEFGDLITCKRQISVVEQQEYSSYPNKNEYFTGVDDLIMPVNSKFDPREGMKCLYYYKPQAVFLVLPDYIQTNYIIASTWISQLYHVLSEFASNCPGDKLLKRIRIILDEFGNLPGFSNMSSMLSVGAGRGILFDFYVQHPHQLHDKYGEKVGEMIEDEAMNYFLLMTRSQKAREDFSALLGKKEITVQSRSGGVFDINKQVTETLDVRPLLEDYELGRLEEGEVVVDRSIHRQDLKGNPVVPYPIFNTGEDGKLMYAHKYLTDQFDPGGSWQDLGLPYVPDIPLEQYSRNFVERIKSPLSMQDNEKMNDLKRKELQEIMNEPEAALDNVYEGVGGNEIATDLEKIDTVYLPGERKQLVEVYGPGHLVTIHQTLVKDKPENEHLIDEFDYYDQYFSYLQKEENKKVLESLQFLGYFTEKQ